MGNRQHDPRVLAIDAGGTMTDTFIVDDAGNFIVGKAQTTPQDESVGWEAPRRTSPTCGAGRASAPLRRAATLTETAS